MVSAHIPKKELASKFEFRVEKGILVGFCKSDVNRVFLSSSRTITKTKDVKIIKNNKAISSDHDHKENTIDYNFLEKELPSEMKEAFRNSEAPQRKQNLIGLAY